MDSCRLFRAAIVWPGAAVGVTLLQLLDEGPSNWRLATNSLGTPESVEFGWLAWLRARVALMRMMATQK